MVVDRAGSWLVLRTKSHQENNVESCLSKKMITAYLPRHSVVHRWKNRKRVLHLPLFPGYVFVQPRDDQFEKMRYIPGSCGLIFAGDKPAAMPEAQVEALRILAGSGAPLAVDPKLIPGQKVEVIAGPFMGIRGELVRVKSQDRLVINAVLLSTSVSVEVDSDKICVL